MKNKLFTIVALFMSAAGAACDLCKAKQPKGFENITHGQGPEGNLDYIIMLIAVIIVGFTLIMSVKYLIQPKEKNENHIKNLVINEENLSD